MSQITDFDRNRHFIIVISLSLFRLLCVIVEQAQDSDSGNFMTQLFTTILAGLTK